MPEAGVSVLKADIVTALRARFSLDAGLGVDYISLPFDIFSSIYEIDEISFADASSMASCDLVHEERDNRSEKSREDSVGISREDKRSSSVPNRSREAASAPEPQSRDGHLSLVPYLPPPPCPDKEAALADMRLLSETCTACELCSKRKSVVWGEGALDADVMFIGEGPGRDEDIEGRPFVGRSGKVLTDIIEKGMRIPRSSVYIANVVKCRPPGNRDPKPEEVAACGEYLRRQIEVIRPKVIVAVGMVAGRALLGLPPGTGGLRRKWHEYAGTPMRVIYHPSYLLRQRQGENHRTEADVETWKDILEVMRRVGGDSA